MSSLVAFDIAELSDADMARFEAAVPVQRRTRAARFRFIDDQKRCLAAGVVLRYALTRHTGGSLRDVAFTTNEFGKPFLIEPRGVYFNLSHAGTWVICATSDTKIGVDIERIDASPVDVAHRLAPDEYSYIVAGSPSDRPRRFAQIWTLKESYLKYLGRGLNVPMDAFSVASTQRRPRILRGELDSAPFLKQVAHGDDYYIAECCADDSPIRIEQPGLTKLLAALS